MKHRLFVLERKIMCHPILSKFVPQKTLYRRILSVFLAFVVITSTTLFYLRPQATEAAWWDESYAYRQKITFVHNAALTNASMRLTVSNTNTLISAGKMQADCDDSRFTDSNGKALRYRLVSGCNSGSTTYDVVFPTVLNGTNLAYFYYGNPSAASLSDSSIPTGTTPSGASAFATEEKGGRPVVYFNFDEGTGTIVNNKGTCGATCSANLNNMSSPAASTSGWTTEGKFGNALMFNGVNNSVIKISPAISRIGGVGDIHSSANTGSQSINVPADATLAVVAVSGAGGTASFFSTTPPTINSVSMQTGRADDASTLYGMSAIFYLVNPSTGSRNLAWDWAGAGTCSSGCHIMYTFYKGINASDPIRSSGGNAALGTFAVTNSMLAQYGDLAVAAGYSNDGTAGKDITWTNATEVIDDIYNNSGGAYAESSPSANLSILTNFIENLGDKTALSSIVIKPAIPATSGINVGNINSVSFWIKTPQTTTEIIDFNGTAYISLSSGSISANGFTDPTIYIDGTATQVFPNDNSWHHIAVTSNTAINAHAVEIGKRGSSYFKGSLDEIKMYNYALTSTQIKSTRNQNSSAVFGMDTKNSLNDGLLAYWPLDNRFYEGVRILDMSGKDEALIATNGGDLVPFTESFTAAGAGTWTSPSDVTSITVETWGGGGAGARRTAAGDGGGGGGGGAYAKSTVSVSPSTQYDYYVGSGGVSSSATNGENSTFESTIVVAAGGKTPAVNSTTGALGGAIADSTGDERRNGGDGANGSATNGGGGGSSAAPGSDGTDATGSSGATAPSGGGNGGLGGSSLGLSGQPPGGGGGGGRYFFSARDGGAGGVGKVNITYNVPQAITGTAGKIGQAFNFDGTNDKITSTNTISNIQSIAFWASPSATTQTLVDFNGSGTNIKINSGAIEANGFINPVIYVDGVQTNTFPDTAWHHIVITSATPHNASAFALGYADSTYYDGLLDEVRLYNRLLGMQEIIRLYEWGPGPRAYWKFDEKTGTTVADSSGNQYNGEILNGAKWTTGKYGGALYLGQELDIQSPSYILASAPEHEDVTISLWFKTDGVQTGVDGATLIAVYNSDGSSTTLSIDTGGNIEYKSDTLGKYYFTSGTRYDDNKWHYVTGITQGASTFIYIDGIPRSLSSGSASGTSGYSLQANIGAGSEGRFKGSLDDIRLYDYARSAKQIISDMNAGHPAVGSPIASALAHYKFDEGYGTTANNSGSLGETINGTLSGFDSPATYGSGWTNNGKFGKALNFDGADDYVETGLDSEIDNLEPVAGNEWTVSAWFKNNGGYSSDAIILGRGGGTGASATFGLYIESSTNTLSTVLKGTATDTGIAVNDNKWHFASITWDGISAMLTLDGKQYALGVGTATLQTGRTLKIGATAGGTLLFPGSIDEVKAYNYALSASEVKTEYNRGGSIVMGALSTNPDGVTASNSAERAYCPPGNTETNCAAGLNPAPVAHWTLDERRGSTARDTSGNGNDGTLTNNPGWTTGKNGASVNFDGVDDHIAIPVTSSTNIQGNEVSLSAWIYATSLNEASAQRIVSMPKNHSVGTERYALLLNSSNDELEFWIGLSVDGHIGVNYSSYLNGWHHVTGVYSNDVMRIYIDGVLVAGPTNHAGTGSLTAWVDGDLEIGRYNTSYGQYFKGKIDDVRIYNYARSQSQVAWDYNRGGPIGHWKFDECQGTTAYDSSGNRINGTISPVGGSGDNDTVGTCGSGTTTEMWNDGTSGKYNSALGFDGTNDGVDILDSTKLDQKYQLSVSAWVKPSSFTCAGVDTNCEIFANYYTWNGYHLIINDLGQVAFYIYDGVPANDIDLVGSPIPTNTWTHVTVTWDGSVIRMYYNGILEASTSPASYTIDYSQDPDITIGRASWYSGNYFNGLIDDVRVYNYPLSPAQVRLLYNENSAVRFAPLTGSP